MILVVHPGSRIRILTFYPSRIPGSKSHRILDLGSGSAALIGIHTQFSHSRRVNDFIRMNTEQSPSSESTSINPNSFLLFLRVDLQLYSPSLSNKASSEIVLLHVKQWRAINRCKVNGPLDPCQLYSAFPQCTSIFTLKIRESQRRTA
jgi:hypothetical protein